MVFTAVLEMITQFLNVWCGKVECIQEKQQEILALHDKLCFIQAFIFAWVDVGYCDQGVRSSLDACYIGHVLEQSLGRLCLLLLP